MLNNKSSNFEKISKTEKCKKYDYMVGNKLKRKDNIMENNKEQKQKKTKKQKYGDVIEDHKLIKRTLMVAGFPAMVSEYLKDGHICYSGFLPGFEFTEVQDIDDFGELMDRLQDTLDDEVEELVVFGKSLPNLPDDEKLMEMYPGHEIKYLDINVYAEPDEDECTHDCSTCGGCSFKTDGNEDYDFGDDIDMGEDDDCDCDDDDCDCHHSDFDDDDCDCHHHD